MGLDLATRYRRRYWLSQFQKWHISSFPSEWRISWENILYYRRQFFR